MSGPERAEPEGKGMRVHQSFSWAVRAHRRVRVAVDMDLSPCPRPEHGVIWKVDCEVALGQSVKEVGKRSPLFRTVTASVYVR
jgi:hypothetical protein